MSPADGDAPAQTLDLRHLETLLAVLDTGSFRAAGRRLGYAQPTVSQHIKRLESVLRAQLIERRPEGCVPTAAGALLRGHAEALIRIGKRAMQALTGRGLAVGACSNIGIYMLQPTVKAFEDLPHGAKLELVLAPNPEIASRLDNGELDLALLEWWDDRPGFTAIAWRREPLVVIVPPDHAWAAQATVDVAQLTGAPLLGGEPGTGTGRILHAALAESGVALTVARNLGSTEAVKRAVQAGNGISIMLAGTVEQEVRAGLLAALPLSGRPLAKTLYAVFRASTPANAPARAFVDALLGRS